MRLPLFISRRLYSGADTDKQVTRQTVVISVAAIALGLAVMIITLGVALGFKREVRNKVVSLGGHVLVQAFESFYARPVPIQMDENLRKRVLSVPGVERVSAFCQTTGVLKTDDTFLGIAFRGVDSTYNLDFLRSHLVAGTLDEPFSTGRSTRRLVISKKMAKDLKLKVGEDVFGYFFMPESKTPRPRKFTVAAIYESGLSDYDRSVAFCDFRTIHQLLHYESDQAAGWEVGVNSFEEIPSVGRQVGAMLNGLSDNYGTIYSTRTIMELNPNIFSWLDLLDTNVLVILVLMFLVAGFSTVSGLFIIILERTQFIGVMKAMGSPNSLLRRVFGLYAMQMAVRGMALGNIVGIGLCLLQQKFRIIPLDASTYYVDAVPMEMNWTYILVLNACLVVLIMLALMLPTLQISRISPARSIRFE